MCCRTKECLKTEPPLTSKKDDVMLGFWSTIGFLETRERERERERVVNRRDASKTEDVTEKDDDDVNDDDEGTLSKSPPVVLWSPFKVAIPLLPFSTRRRIRRRIRRRAHSF